MKYRNVDHPIRDYADREPAPRGGLMEPVGNAVGTVLFLIGLPFLIDLVLRWPA